MFSHAFMRSTVRQRNFWLYRSFHFLSTLRLLSCKVCLMEGSQTRHSRTGGVNPLVRQFELAHWHVHRKQHVIGAASEWPVIRPESAISSKRTIVLATRLTCCFPKGSMAPFLLETKMAVL